jgi:hypothetical protein
MPLDATHTAYATFDDADEAWHSELVRLFGKSAVEVRYTAAGQGEPGSDLRRLHDAFGAAGDVWRAAMREAEPLTECIHHDQ